MCLVLYKQFGPRERIVLGRTIKREMREIRPRHSQSALCRSRELFGAAGATGLHPACRNTSPRRLRDRTARVIPGPLWPGFLAGGLRSNHLPKSESRNP